MKKQIKIKKRRKLNRKQNESKKEMKQNERKYKRKNMVDDIDINRFFEIATTNKKYVNGLKSMFLKMKFQNIIQAILI